MAFHASLAVHADLTFEAFSTTHYIACKCSSVRDTLDNRSAVGGGRRPLSDPWCTLGARSHGAPAPAPSSLLPTWLMNDAY